LIARLSQSINLPDLQQLGSIAVTETVTAELPTSFRHMRQANFRIDYGNKTAASSATE